MANKFKELIADWRNRADLENLPDSYAEERANMLDKVADELEEIAGDVEIEVCERTMDYHLAPAFQQGNFIGMEQHPKYHAQIKGEPGYWACGISPAEAIGSLIRFHSERFGIKVTYLPKQAR